MDKDRDWWDEQARNDYDIENKFNEQDMRLYELRKLRNEFLADEDECDPAPVSELITKALKAAEEFYRKQKKLDKVRKKKEANNV